MRFRLPALSALLLFAVLSGFTRSVAVEPVDFDTQVMPILTKAGCNAGSCHGAAAGRGGFHLSLYGSRPEQDFEEIAWALEGRRVHQRKPDLSLLLLKPTEQVSHEGGTRLEIDGTGYQTLRRWIQAGAIRTPGRTLQDFQFGLTDDAARVFVVGQAAMFAATAEFSDGTRHDVLPWTIIKANDSTATPVGDDGRVSVLRPGRHVLIARYLDRVVPFELLATATEQTSARPADAAPAAIDDFIDRRLGKLGLSAATVTRDAEFLRRVTLDLTGRLPTLQALTAFQNDNSVNKRRVLIDRLLQSDAFHDYWCFLLAGQFRISQINNSEQAQAYYQWFQNSIEHDVGLNNMARQLVLAEGLVREHGPASFYAVARDARDQAEFFSRAFLGVRLECANCHDHPLDAWTQDDYHGLAAIFASIKRGPVIEFTNSGEVIHPATGEPAVPKIPAVAGLVSQADHRPQLAAWLTSPENPYFAKAAVNRIWKHLLGRGLVSPVDDLGVTNPATHPQLLDWLAAHFIDDGYRLRPTIRRICQSQVYQRSSRGAHTSSADLFYAHAIAKPLSSAVFLDAIADVTGVPEVLNEREFRAVSLAGLTAPFESLESLGDCDNRRCETSSAMSSGLPVALHLLSGDTLNSRIADPEGNLMKAVMAREPAAELIEQWYRRSFCRSPSAQEQTFWERQFSGAGNHQQFSEIAQDFLWSLLNSQEFRTNQ